MLLIFGFVVGLLDTLDYVIHVVLSLSFPGDDRFRRYFELLPNRQIIFQYRLGNRVYMIEQLFHKAIIVNFGG